jgi:hypothetical protein
MKINHGFIMPFLAIMSQTATSDWIEVARHADQSYVSYLDPASKTATADGYRIWKMRDYLEPQKESEVPYQYLSDKTLSEYDCTRHRVRELSLEDFADHRATGSRLNAMAIERPWQTIAPGSIGEASYEYVCNG